jgi:hypothetical protein
LRPKGPHRDTASCCVSGSRAGSQHGWGP